jgi:hypothetical protein
LRLESRLATKKASPARGVTGVLPRQLAVAAGFEPAKGCPPRAFEFFFRSRFSAGTSLGQRVAKPADPDSQSVFPSLFTVTGSS